MKKSTAVVAVVAALVLAYGGASWYIGKQAQTKVTQAVEEANQKLITVLGPDFSGEDLKISILEYQRGIFSSDVKYSLQLRDADGEAIELLLQDDLQHGPFPWGALASGTLKPLLAYSQSKLIPTETLKPWFDSAKGEPMQVRTSIGLGGEGVSDWRFAPVDLAKDDVRISFSGADLNMNFAGNWEEGTADGGFALLDIKDDTGQLLIRDVVLESNAKRNDENVLQSESKASVGLVQVSGSELADVELGKLEVALSSEQQGDIIDGDLRYTFGSVKASGMDLGTIGLRVSATGLDAKVLGELAALLEQSDPEEVGMGTEASGALAAKFVELFKTAPSISIDPLSWRNDKGESRLILNVDLKDGSAQEAEIAELAYLDKANLDVTISRDMFLRLFSQAQGGEGGDAEAMESFGGMLFDQYTARLHGAGLVAQESGDIAIKISYTDGNIDLNGQTMPVEEFIQRAMMAAM